MPPYLYPLIFAASLLFFVLIAAICEENIEKKKILYISFLCFLPIIAALVFAVFLSQKITGTGLLFVWIGFVYIVALSSAAGICKIKKERKSRAHALTYCLCAATVISSLIAAIVLSIHSEGFLRASVWSIFICSISASLVICFFTISDDRKKRIQILVWCIGPTVIIIAMINVIVFTGNLPENGRTGAWGGFFFGSGLVLVATGLVSCLMSEKEDTRQREESNAKKKEALIEKLAESSIEELVNVPEGISFDTDGVPVEKDRCPFVFLEVFTASKGRTFHLVRGCRSAEEAASLSDAVSRRKQPCSVCCKNTDQIPQWYLDYLHLRLECKKYGVSVEKE